MAKAVELKLFTASDMTRSYKDGKIDGRQELMKEIRQLIGVPEPVDADEPSGLDDLRDIGHPTDG